MSKWKREAEMCAAMVPVYREAGFTVYPETSGWDQLLVREDGFQVGIQAKLRANFVVLNQARDLTPEGHPKHGPDVRAVLVPRAVKGFEPLARDVLRLWVIEAEDYVEGACSRFWGSLAGKFRGHLALAPLVATEKRCWLPPFVPEVPAGVPAPRRVTKWRIKAIDLCDRLRRNGYVTRKDFKELKLSLQLWLQRRQGKPAWLVQERGTRPARFTAAPGVELPDVGYCEKESST